MSGGKAGTDREIHRSVLAFPPLAVFLELGSEVGFAPSYSVVKVQTVSAPKGTGLRQNGHPWGSTRLHSAFLQTVQYQGLHDLSTLAGKSLDLPGFAITHADNSS